MLPTRGLIRAHLHDRVARGHTLFERETPLPEAWHFYASRDATILALIEEREKIVGIPWLALDPEFFGQQSNNVPTITRKQFEAMERALNKKAA